VTSRRRCSVIAAIGLCAVACAPAAAPRPGQEPLRSVDVRDRIPRPAAEQRADPEVADALELVARVRQLPVLAKVPGIRLGRAELKREIADTLSNEAPDELVSGNTELLFAFDVVDRQFDLKLALNQLYGAQLAGFYDPDTKRMVLASDLSEDEQALTLYHELVHALQDQHYHLAGALDWKPEQSDAQTALQALAEGDATLAMLDIARSAAGLPELDFPVALLQLDSLLMQAKPEFAKIPGLLIRALVAPYADGLTFVRELRARGAGWKAVDAAWRERPISTEQILHPHKYFAREPVVALPPVAPPPGFGAATFRDVMGEQGLKLLFEEWAPAQSAALAATGWGGDRIAVFKDAERNAVLWHIVFDDEASAARSLSMLARGALRPELATLTGGARPRIDARQADTAVASGRLCINRGQRGPFALVRHGRHVGVTLGPYPRVRTADASADKCPLALAWASALAQR
jgi:hypothetical protein